MPAQVFRKTQSKFCAETPFNPIIFKACVL